jgi:hypothetical protein
MGEKLVFKDERNTKLFNSPIEIGLRVLFILYKFSPQTLNIDKLIYFDYFLIHSSDIDKSQQSLHPKYPFRSTEVIIKRELLNLSLKLLIAKQLIEVVFEENGITYKTTKIGQKFIEFMESDYAKEIAEKSEWLHSTFKDYPDIKLLEIVNSNIEKWGSEFNNESKFRGVS